MAALRSRCGHYIFVLWFLLSFYLSIIYLAYSQPSQIGYVPYFHTWCGPVQIWDAGLKCVARGSLKMQDAKIAICAYHRTNLSGYIFATIRHVSIIGKKPVKQEYLLQMFPQYGELQPTEICLQVWGIPANFNGFRVLPSLLQRRHLLEGRPTKHCTMFGRLLRWHTIYIFGDSCPLTVFCPVQNSLYVQVPLSLE